MLWLALLPDRYLDSWKKLDWKMKRLNLFPIRHIVKKEDTYNLLILLSSLIYSKHVGQKINKKFFFVRNPFKKHLCLSKHDLNYLFSYICSSLLHNISFPLITILCIRSHKAKSMWSPMHFSSSTNMEKM